MTWRKTLEPPIVCRAGASMGLFDVQLSDPGIVLNHFKRTVAEERLERKYVTTGAQIGDGERVPKTVRMAVLDFGLFAQRARTCRKESRFKGLLNLPTNSGAVGASPSARVTK